MIDKDIEYKSIIMRCDNVNTDAFVALSPNTIVEFYTKSMEYIWIDIQKSVGEFAGYSDKEIYNYFHKLLNCIMTSVFVLLRKIHMGPQ